MAPAFREGSKQDVKDGKAEYWVPKNTETNAVIATKNQTTKNIGGTVKPGAMGSQYVSGGNDITHQAVTYLTKDSSGAITGATRVLYIENDKSQWRPAAISKDGGKTYQFSDPDYPLMATGGPKGGPVAGAALQNDLNSTDSDIHKNLDTQVNKSFVRVGADKLKGRGLAIDSIKNNADVQEIEEASDDANTPLNDDQQIDAASSPSAIKDLKIGERGGTRSASGSFRNHVYPLDLGVTGQDVLKFTMLKYVPSDINMSGGSLGVDTSARNSGDREILGTVILPIPGGISDNNQVSWGSQNMNPAEVAAANFALNTIMKGPDGAALATENLVKSVTGSSDVKNAAGVVIAGAAAGVGQQLITRTTGAVINPSMELLFSGPSLRQFSFKFTFTARESAESKEIVKILRFFKQGSAVQRTASNLFLKSPHTFKIQYLYRGPEGGENPFMGKIKECACTGVNVNYTPQNNYSTFSDGAMTSYEMSLNFNELEPVFNDEYANDGDTSIGF
jgi:hypothetical protein